MDAKDIVVPTDGCLAHLLPVQPATGIKVIHLNQQNVRVRCSSIYLRAQCIHFLTLSLPPCVAR